MWFVNRSSPTPLVMFYVMKHELSYGMMVTASHNPAIYNGIKVFTYGAGTRMRSRQQRLSITWNRQRNLYLPNEGGKRTDAAAIPPGACKGRAWSGEINPMNEYLDNIISVDQHGRHQRARFAHCH